MFLPGPAYAAAQESTDVWIVKDLLPIEGILSLYGRAKTGKSYLVLQIAEAIANPFQTHFLDFEIHLHGSVLYVQLDTAGRLWRRNYIVPMLEWPGHDLENVLFTDRMDKDLPVPFSILGDGGKWLRSEVLRLKPLVVVFDTTRNVHAGDENDSTVMSNVMEAMRNSAPGAAIIMISHPRKSDANSSSDTVDDTRGSSVVNASADVIGKLTKTRFIVKGRTDRGEDDFAKIIRRDDGFWELQNSASQRDMMIRSILQTEGKTREELTTLVAQAIGKSERTARREIKRIEEGGA